MKKTLVALAALAATGAYAQVTLSGIMDAGYFTGTSYGQSYSLVDQSGARTTTFKFNGVEDLGGGMKANFQFEVQPLIIATDGNQIRNAAGWGNSSATAVSTAGVVTGSNGASQAGAAGFYQSGLTGKGNTYIGVVGPFGDIRFGTNNSASLAAHLNGAGAWGTGIGSGYGFNIGSTSSNTYTRFESSIAYYSPTVSGVQLRALTNFKNDSQYGSTTSGTTARRPSIMEFGAQYANGPVQLNVAQFQIKTSPNESTASPTGGNNYTVVPSNVTTKRTTASASYDAKVARFGVTYAAVTTDAGNTITPQTAATTAIALSTTAGATDTKAMMYNVQVPMGQWRFLGSTGFIKVNASPESQAIGNKNTITGVGVEYDLSKRTYLYARYQAGKAEAANASSTIVKGTVSGGAAAALADPNYNLTAVGVSHAF